MLLKGQDSTRESFPRCVSEPVAVVSIYLQGMQDLGPSKVAYEHLVPYLNGNTCHVGMDFNLDTPQGQTSFRDRLQSVVDLFETGSLQRCVGHIYRYKFVKICLDFDAFSYF